MKRKYIYIFMQLFTSLCLVSVGFASWTFVSGDSITASGNIVAQDVIDSTYYVKLTNQNKIRYYKSGFVTPDDKVSLTGNMSVEYTIYLSNCRSLYKDFDSLKVLLYLDADYNIFEDVEVAFNVDFSHSIQYTLGQNGIDSFDNSKYCLEVTLIDILNNESIETDFILTVNYSFKVKNKDNEINDYDEYMTNIYPKMKDLKLNSTVLINGEIYEED